MRRAGRRDELHRAAGEFFEYRGWTGIDMASLGNDVPDWAFFKGTVGFCLEVKSPNSIRHKQADSDGLTDGQREFHRLFRGLIFTAQSVEDFWKVANAVEPGIAERIEPREP
jgi:hypothetical protein